MRRTRPSEPIDCPHGGRHKHGTRLAYLHDKCGCDACRAAQAAYARHARRMRAYGRSRHYVDATAATEHLLALRALGVGTVRMEAYTGLSHTNLAKLLNREHKLIRTDNEQTVLAMPLDPAAYPTGDPIDMTGTTRRLRALVAIGYGVPMLGPMLGVHEDTVRSIVEATAQATVYPFTAAKVKALYERLSNTPRTGATTAENISIALARRWAKMSGWVPPMYWDDDEIDDPSAPDPLMEESRRTDEDLVAEVEWLRRGGTFYKEVPRRLGYEPKTLARKLYRLDRPDLARWIEDRSERRAS